MTDPNPETRRTGIVSFKGLAGPCVQVNIETARACCLAFRKALMKYMEEHGDEEWALRNAHVPAWAAARAKYEELHPDHPREVVNREHANVVAYGFSEAPKWMVGLE